MIRIATALALLLALGQLALGEAAAASPQGKTPKLKELAAVTSEVVRIGDLVENAGSAANVPIFRSPDLGQTGSVPVQRIAEALRPHDLSGVDTDGLSEVVVTRLSRAITGKDISARIARAIAGQYGFGEAQNISVTFDRDVRVMHVEATATADLMVTRINADPRSGRFDIAFELPGSAMSRRLPLRFTGTAREMIEVATLTRPLRQGETIKGADVTIERRPKLETGTDAVSPEQAIGMAVRQPMRAGQAVRVNDLMKPVAVQRNEPVILVYEMPGVLLSIRGKAVEAGSIGDIVNVINVQSNRTVQATVTGPGRVTVASARPVVASATPSGPADQTAGISQ